MVECMIKTINHGITILAVTPGIMDCWDDHLVKILFGYRCGIQASTRFSPFMILTGCTPRLRADNYMHALTTKTDVSAKVEVAAAQFSVENGVHCKHPRKHFAQCGVSTEAAKEDLCHPKR